MKVRNRARVDLLVSHGSSLMALCYCTMNVSSGQEYVHMRGTSSSFGNLLELKPKASSCKNVLRVF